MGSRTTTLQLCRAACAVAIALQVAGCATKTVDQTDNTYRNALIGVKEEWLDYCDTLGDRPGNAVGDMQQDFTGLAVVAAQCAAGKRSLVDYLRPYVTKAKAPDQKK